METATEKQVKYLAFLAPEFVGAEKLTKKEASQMIGGLLKANKTKARFGVRVGDVFAFSFGYDATLWEFFQVIRIISSNSVEVREIESENVGSFGGLEWDVKPVLNKFKPSSYWSDGDRMRKIIKESYSKPGKPALSFDGHEATRINPDDVFHEDDYH